MNNIVGYKVPFDLFTGTETPIKKGYILVKHPKFEHVYVYSPFYEIGEGYGICKEIVETWEAVYENATLIKDLPLQEHRKIIGYKLLKDLPTLKAGVIFEIADDIIIYNKQRFDYAFHNSVLQDIKDWFEPVYEKSQEEIITGLAMIFQHNSFSEAIDIILKMYEIKEKE
jgi:hypothetical protein